MVRIVAPSLADFIFPAFLVVVVSAIVLGIPSLLIYGQAHAEDSPDRSSRGLIASLAFDLPTYPKIHWLLRRVAFVSSFGTFTLMAMWTLELAVNGDSIASLSFAFMLFPTWVIAVSSTLWVRMWRTLFALAVTPHLWIVFIAVAVPQTKPRATSV